MVLDTSRATEVVLWVQKAVLGGSLEARRPDEEGRGRTLVFAEDVAAAKEVTKCLHEAGATVLAYHRDVPAAAREAALATLARYFTRQAAHAFCNAHELLTWISVVRHSIYVDVAHFAFCDGLPGAVHQSAFGGTDLGVAMLFPCPKIKISPATFCVFCPLCLRSAVPRKSGWLAAVQTHGLVIVRTART